MARHSVQESGVLLSISVTALALLCSQFNYVKNDHKNTVHVFIMLMSSKYCYKVSLNERSLKRVRCNRYSSEQYHGFTCLGINLSFKS